MLLAKPRAPRSPLRALLLAAGTLAAAACGARSALPIEPAGAATSGGAAGAGGGGAGAGGTGGAPVVACDLVAPGSPWIALARPGCDAHTPSLAPIDGDSGVIALQSVTQCSAASDGIEVMAAAIGEGPWPAAATIAEAPLLLGPDTWTYAQMVRTRAASPEVALAWEGEPGVLRLGKLDVATWTAGEIAAVASPGSTPLGLAAGAGTGPLGVGYGGDGFAVTWEASTGLPVAAVLDASGAVVIGPHEVLGTAPLPDDVDPAVVWSGSTYLLAAGVSACPLSFPECVGHSMVIKRIRPATGDLVDDSGIEHVAYVPALGPGDGVYRAELAVFGGRVFLAWSEAVAPGAPRSVRVAELAPSGDVIGGPVTVASGVAVQHGVDLTASALGVIVAWGKDGDPSLPDDAPGRSRIVFHQLDLDLAPRVGPLALDVTRIGSFGAPAALALDHPRSLIFAWSGRAPSVDQRVVFVTRVDCLAPL